MMTPEQARVEMESVRQAVQQVRRAAGDLLAFADRLMEDMERFETRLAVVDAALEVLKGGQ